MSLTQGNNTRVLGFYPNRPVYPLVAPSQQSVLVNDGSHKYDVKLTTILGASQVSQILNFIKNYTANYHLSNYNCTDFAIECMEEANVILQDTYGSWPGGGGSNPGDLGEDIRAMTSNNSYTVSVSSGNAPINSGICN